MIEIYSRDSGRARIQNLHCTKMKGSIPKDGRQKSNKYTLLLFSHFGNIKFRQIKPWSPQIVSYSKEIFLNTLSAFKRSLAALIFSWKYSFNYLIAICYHFSKSRWHILFNKPRAFRVLQTPWLSFPFGFHLWIRSQSAKYYSLCNSLSQRL